ncbi:MAG: hypothetical protein K0R54_2081 [Clostridiaceae bacterium]|nr:hypothetical protein [Clostridiaceae bacterium]
MKSKYTEYVEPKLVLVEGWARNGLTEEQIAHNLGIGYSTLKEYKNKYPALLAALKKGKEVIDLEVENALLKRALGYKYNEVTKERDSDGKLVVTKEVLKEVNPDTTAQIFWLKNRKPADWRDKKDIEQTGNMNINLNNPYKDLTPEELRQLIKNDS